jgi:hypothetical protein
LRLAVDIFPCEDGHAQERRLFGQVLDISKIEILLFVRIVEGIFWS